jgi:parvulin-like peptidyl-prolyl isomerase
MLSSHVDGAGLDLVARQFGSDFADALPRLRINEWNGPIRSPFGDHLVRITAYVPGVPATLETARVAVAREWENERRVAARTAAYRKLRERYNIVIDAPEPHSVAIR